MTKNNRTDKVFLNRPATAAMNSYVSQVERTFEEIISGIMCYLHRLMNLVKIAVRKLAQLQLFKTTLSLIPHLF